MSLWDIVEIKYKFMKQVTSEESGGKSWCVDEITGLKCKRVEFGVFKFKLHKVAGKRV